MDCDINLDDYTVEEIKQMIESGVIPEDYPEWFYCNSQWDDNPDA